MRSWPTMTRFIWNMAASTGDAAASPVKPGVGASGAGGGIESSMSSVSWRLGCRHPTSHVVTFTVVFGAVRSACEVAVLQHGVAKANVKPGSPHRAAGRARGLERSIRCVAAARYLHGVRLLVVDDEPDLADAVARGLRREGYAVDVAYGGVDALEKAELVPYDLICLDLTMPDVDGLEVCRRLRESVEHELPARVLMLTARDDLEDRVAGLDAGADDYLVKPFAYAELSARVRTLLRRDAGTSGAVLEVGDLVLDTARHTAARGDRALELTAKEFALLRYFMTSPGRVISQEELLDHVLCERKRTAPR